VDFITAGGILICIGVLWIFSALMLRLIYRLQERIEYLELVQNEQRCQHCRWRADCPAYDTGVGYPCKHFEEELL